VTGDHAGESRTRFGCHSCFLQTLFALKIDRISRR
jgi:hypothetical protein